MRLIEIGMLVIFVGIILIVIGSFLQAKTSDKTDSKTKVAVGGLIGPIPFGFANDKKMLWFVLGIIAVFVIIQIVMRFVSG